MYIEIFPVSASTISLKVIDKLELVATSTESSTGLNPDFIGSTLSNVNEVELWVVPSSVPSFGVTLNWISDWEVLFNVPLPLLADFVSQTTVRALSSSVDVIVLTWLVSLLSIVGLPSPDTLTKNGSYQLLPPSSEYSTLVVHVLLSTSVTVVMKDR